MPILTEKDQATSTSSDSRRDLTALLGGCGIYKADRALVSLAGRDRVRWLNGMVTNNIRDLAAGHGVYAFVLNPQGHVLGDLYVFNRGESLMLEIERAQLDTLLAIFRKYIIMDKVEIEDLSDKLAVIGVAGAKSADVLATLKVPLDLPYLKLLDTTWNAIPITLVRGDNPFALNYELFVAKDNAEAVSNALFESGAGAVQNESLEALRILCGIPKFGQDIRERTLPQETGQERALNFTKGCYIGQEIVERIRSRGAVHRMFMGFELAGSVAAGTKIQSEGKDVGEITSVMDDPIKGKQLALGYLRKEYAGGDKQLRAGEAIVKPVNLPLSGLFS
ncbi:MAG TPA: glycine cleavage T C-terminal barrel domain-containing protein [Terriglobales bacterium]|nr:glycine cleavage T C-terminal barrel domain-containing protein [Terriglobales bacterium]